MNLYSIGQLSMKKSQKRKEHLSNSLLILKRNHKTGGNCVIFHNVVEFYSI